MREMYKKLFFAIVLLSTTIAFSSCSDDDDDLTLEKSEISVNQGESATIEISSGNGGYSVISANEAIATAVIENNKITITGVKGGETTITLTDKEKKSSVIKVDVRSYADQIDGDYKGKLVITIPSVTPVEIEREIELDESGENIKVTLSDFSFSEEIKLGDIIVDGVALTKEDGVISLTEKTVPLSLNLLDNPIDVDVTVSGTVKEGTLDLKIVVGKVPIFKNIDVTFSGKKTED